MIKSKDRSRWFGASDTATIMGNWNTPTFHKWWLVKMGLRVDSFSNLAMRTGTAYEHKILDHIGITKKDRQIRVRQLRLRVNLDGENKSFIYEVKTSGKPFKPSKANWQQCQVQMFVAKLPCRIVSYLLQPEDYTNWYNQIDASRITEHSIEYDPDWIKTEYLPRLEHLAHCLKKGKYPDPNMFAKRKS
jgi:hypothetical protein